MSDSMIVNIYTDGASRSNPGKSASGYAVYDNDDNFLLGKSFYNGIKTNNAAEYLAIIAALESVSHEYGYDIEVNLYSDSELAVKQLKGSYKVKNPDLKKLNEEAVYLLKKFEIYSLFNVPREHPHIAEVDAELNKLLDKY
jgi:ribonuclease HI